MTHRFRTKRLVLLAASATMVAGGALVPTTAFAATPATSHTVALPGDDIGDGNKSTLLFLGEPDHAIRIVPYKDAPGKGGAGKKSDGKWGKKHPGKGGPSEDTGVKTPKGTDWQCITAPCGPPDSVHPEVLHHDFEGTVVPTGT
ncbi:hypothetical protein [Streptomyces sp. HUAS TT3]|uniref:hypothetical protein n=1 Tax=Streptomyces sp. HUAS TT3 TaxID=3447510 RepID=UPI003F65A077